MEFLKDFGFKNDKYKLRKFKNLIDGMDIAVYRRPNRKMGAQYFDNDEKKSQAIVMTSPDGKAWQAVKKKKGYQKFIEDAVANIPDVDVILINYAGPEGYWPINTAMQDRASRALKWITEKYDKVAVTGTSKGGWMAWKLSLKFDIPAVVCCPVGRCGGTELSREHAPEHWNETVFQRKSGTFMDEIMPITEAPKILYLHGSADTTFPWEKEPRKGLIESYATTNKIELSIIEGGTHNLYDSQGARGQGIEFIKRF